MKTDYLQRLKKALQLSNKKVSVSEGNVKVKLLQKLNIFSRLFYVRDKDIKYRVDPTVKNHTTDEIVHIEFVLYKRNQEIGVFQINNTQTLGYMVTSLVEKLGLCYNINNLSIYLDNHLYVSDMSKYTPYTNYQLRNWNNYKMKDLILLNKFSLNNQREILYELQIRNIIGRNRECCDFVMKIFDRAHRCVICVKNVAKVILTDEPLLDRTKKYVCKTCFSLFYCDELGLIYPHLKYSDLR